MHEYDIALKTLLQNGRESLLALTSTTVERWHNVELPEVRSRRVDLLGETPDGRLIHIELQSTNDGEMALRMMEYFAAVYRKFGRFPEQLVLYVGAAPLRMSGSLRSANLSFDCRIADFRELDGERLLASDRVADNILAILARVDDQRAAIQKVLGRIAASDAGDRANALAAFMVLAGLRQLEQTIEQEAHKMPLLDDIMDNKVLGREFKRGLHAGEIAVLFRQVEKRFGSISPKFRDRVSRMSAAEIESTTLRLLDAKTIEELFD